MAAVQAGGDRPYGGPPPSNAGKAPLTCIKLSHALGLFATIIVTFGLPFYVAYMVFIKYTVDCSPDLRSWGVVFVVVDLVALCSLTVAARVLRGNQMTMQSIAWSTRLCVLGPTFFFALLESIWLLVGLAYVSEYRMQGDARAGGNECDAFVGAMKPIVSALCLLWFIVVPGFFGIEFWLRYRPKKRKGDEDDDSDDGQGGSRAARRARLKRMAAHAKSLRKYKRGLAAILTKADMQDPDAPLTMHEMKRLREASKDPKVVAAAKALAAEWKAQGMRGFSSDEDDGSNPKNVADARKQASEGKEDMEPLFRALSAGAAVAQSRDVSNARVLAVQGVKVGQAVDFTDPSTAAPAVAAASAPRTAVAGASAESKRAAASGSSPFGKESGAERRRRLKAAGINPNKDTKKKPKRKARVAPAAADPEAIAAKQALAIKAPSATGGRRDVDTLKAGVAAASLEKVMHRERQQPTAGMGDADGGSVAASLAKSVASRASNAKSLVATHAEVKQMAAARSGRPTRSVGPPGASRKRQGALSKAIKEADELHRGNGRVRK